MKPRTGIFPSEAFRWEPQLPLAGSNVGAGTDGEEGGILPVVESSPMPTVAEGSSGESENSELVLGAGGSVICS